MQLIKKLNSSYSASTLIETIVAFVIITVLTAIFFTFITGTIRNRRSTELKLKAAIASENIINEIKTTGNYGERQYEFDDLFIDMTSEKLFPADSAYLIILHVKNNKKEIILTRRLIAGTQLFNYETF
jgi:type II secretory pathway pseudopilin PulG